MSSYIVEEENETTIIINGKESESYHLLYSEIQRRRKDKVLKQMNSVWYNVEKLMLFYISHNVDTDPIMQRVSKLFFLEMKLTKQQDNDIKQRNQSRKDRIKKLNKLRKSKNPI